MFKLIIISHPTPIDNEAYIINALFDKGLECFHLRKPTADSTEYENFIKQINPQFLNRIVIHSHYSLIEKYNLKGIHLTSEFYESIPKDVLAEKIKRLHKHRMTVSTSLHHIHQLQTTQEAFDYVFLSPLFESISKPNYKNHISLTHVKDYLHHPKSTMHTIIALGGITNKNIHVVYNTGFHGAALLGYIWAKPTDALHNYSVIHTEILQFNKSKIHQTVEKNRRPFVLSIAGFDPCGGAGVLADIKTMEAHKVNGLAVATSITYQNENTIRGIQWLETQEIIHQINPLLEKYDLNVVKIGLIKNLEHLKEIVKYLKEKKSTIKIIWDPILKSSSGFTYHESMNKEEVFELCRDIFLITPNIFEACIAGSNDPYKSSQILSCYTNVYLKGGHNETEKGRDYLFIKNNLPDNKNVKNFRPKGKNLKEKHGSGCVLSSAIAANIAKGYPLLRACLMAKQYVQYFLNSNDGLLGYHKI